MRKDWLLKGMNERIKNMFKGKKKTENLVALIIILIITVVAINYILGGNQKGTTTKEEKNIKANNAIQVSTGTVQDELEQRLENILGKIEGVGKVKVMLTYSESSTLKPVYNEDSKISNTNETDSNGGTRVITETDSQKEVIFKENTDGTKEPVTQSIISPKIEGAIVAAGGANNASVKASIIQAIEAATGLATHKIQVFKMED